MKRTFTDFESVLKDSWYRNVKLGFEAEFLYPLPRVSDSVYDGDIYCSIAEKLGEYLGEEITYGTVYHSYSRRNEVDGIQVTTHIEPDSSVSPSKSQSFISRHYQSTVANESEYYYVSVEIVSKVFSDLKTMLNYLEDVFCFISQNKGITNETTGFHFTISGLNFDIIPWNRVYYISGMYDILKKFNRTNCSFAMPSFRTLYYTMRDQVKADYAAHAKYSFSLFQMVEQYSTSLDYGKYNDINIRARDTKGCSSVEFRGMGGWWYHLRFDEVKRCILRILWAIKESQSVSSFDFRHDIRKLFRNSTPFENIMSQGNQRCAILASIELDRKTRRDIIIDYLEYNRGTSNNFTGIFRDKKTIRNFCINMAKALYIEKSVDADNYSEAKLIFSSLKNIMVDNIWASYDESGAKTIAKRWMTLPTTRLTSLDIMCLRSDSFKFLYSNDESKLTAFYRGERRNEGGAYTFKDAAEKFIFFIEHYRNTYRDYNMELYSINPLYIMKNIIGYFMGGVVDMDTLKQFNEIVLDNGSVLEYIPTESISGKALYDGCKLAISATSPKELSTIKERLCY